MRRKSEQLFLLIERTVPVLLAIGAVLSVLSLLFRGNTGILIACAAGWILTLIVAVADFVLSWILQKKSSENLQGSSVRDSRDQILSEVAHELKTPLTVIRGSAEVLSDGAVPPEQYPEYFARILRETDAMTKLVSDLLDATRKQETLRFDPQPTDLAALGQAVCDDLRDVASASGVELRFEVKKEIPLLMLDPDRIGQLAVILLDNAVKHTASGGKVILSLDCDSREVLLRVLDNGSGIAPEDIPYVFDRYYKAPVSRGGLASGTGIGLSVAKKIAALHGGTIEVKSKIGKGTLFTVRIPLFKYKVK